MAWRVSEAKAEANKPPLGEPRRPTRTGSAGRNAARPYAAFWADESGRPANVQACDAGNRKR